MKAIKSVFLLILLMGTSLSLYAESYLTQNPTWTYGAFDTYSSFPSLKSVSVYSLGGDTLINGSVFKKVMLDDNYSGAIREEGKKWFAIPFWLVNQTLTLYDFSAKMGDTIFHYASNGYSYPNSIVTKVDSITLENGERRLRMTVNYGEIWIEGIGDTHTLFMPIEPVTTCMLRCVGCIGSLKTLLCYKQQGVVQYSDLTNAPNGCTYKVSQDLDGIDQSDGLKWVLTSDAMLDYRVFGSLPILQNVKLINLSGSTVWEARAGFENGGGRIPVSHLKHGIYLLSVRTTKGVEVQKVSL